MPAEHMLAKGIQDVTASKAGGSGRVYEHPIPERDEILEVLKRGGAPMHFETLAGALALDAERDLEALRRRLGAMRRDGQVVRNREGAIGITRKMDLITGRVSAHRDGYGFLIPEPGQDEVAGSGDLYLSSRQMRALMHGDRAVARVMGLDRNGRREGAVVEVLERETEQVVGRFWRESGVCFVRPEDARIQHDILIPGDATGGATEGQIVVARLREGPSKRAQPVGEIEEVLGDHLAPGMEIDIAIRSHGLPVEFGDKALAEAAAFGEEIPARARRGREDLRDLPLVTIDGRDARDFDDAVHCARTPKGWKLTVAIADVAAYVKPGKALEQSARDRGNSVYFPERVLPMLPESLSNGLCSLRPDVDRLALVCEMLVRRDGHVIRSRFFNAVIRSHNRFTYDQVAAIVVERDPVMRERFGHLLGEVDELYALFKAFNAARRARGALDLDSVESRIVFGADRKIDRIEAVIRNDAHRIIEECMIAANVAAAGFLARHRLPGLYRVHEGPQADALDDLRVALGTLGLKLGGG
ncbi:MAG: ribonuclease R family protein, partial [Gammaproteobacteria bacterium]